MQNWLRTWLGCFGGLAVVWAVGMDVSAAEPQPNGDAMTGHEIFLREWLPNDPRSHGGDGLGPVFNDSSCVSCHNQGGVGGGGPLGKNVNIVTAVFAGMHGGMMFQPQPSAAEQLFRGILGLDPVPASTPRRTPLSDKQVEKRRNQLLDEVAKIHPGFRTAGSVVVHHGSTTDEYSQWRSKFLNFGFQDFGQHRTMVEFSPFLDSNTVIFAEETAAGEVSEGVQVNSNVRPRDGMQAMQQVRMQAMVTGTTSSVQQNGNFVITLTQRNPSALFGVGRIDSVPDEVLEAAAKRKFEKFPEISGRVARLNDGKIGRFGWKAQKATLRDFTVTACAVELGLNTPEHSQSGNPLAPEYETTGFDLTKDECTQLVEYLRDLPAPAAQTPAHAESQKFLAGGEKLFAAIGCATCHTSELGEVKGIYSDLLLHDMGADLGDTGSYGVFVPNSPGDSDSSPVPPLAELKQQMELSRGGFVETAEVGKPIPSAAEPQPEKIIGALQQEWRTPPLWGVRDSAPYLHDGRAGTLEQAIAFHGGEAQRSAHLFFALKPAQRLQVVSFLKSLTAPTEVATAK